MYTDNSARKVGPPAGNTCYGSQYTQNQFMKVSTGPTLDNQLQGMYLKGKNVLKTEIKAARKIPQKWRVLYDKKLTE